MTTKVDRSDFARIQGISPKVIRFFEELFGTTQSTAAAVSSGAEATQSIQDATVLALSPNAAFNNERVIDFDSGQFLVVDGGPGGSYSVQLVSFIATNGGYQCTFNLEADTNLTLPSLGRVPSSADGPYADDAAAAAAGVEVGEWYAKTGGTVVWRVT